MDGSVLIFRRNTKDIAYPIKECITMELRKMMATTATKVDNETDLLASIPPNIATKNAKVFGLARLVKRAVLKGDLHLLFCLFCLFCF